MSSIIIIIYNDTDEANIILSIIIAILYMRLCDKENEGLPTFETYKGEKR